MSDRTETMDGGRQGTELTRFNALRHGILSRYVLLPWEDAGAYRDLLDALVAEHAPEGPTEEHLVEELAGILWRKRRLQLAEAAAHRRGLQTATERSSGIARAALAHKPAAQHREDVSEAIGADEATTEAAFADIDEDEAMAHTARERLRGGGPGAYEEAVAELRADSREWWQNLLATDPTDRPPLERELTPDEDGLRQFIETVLLPLLARQRVDLRQRPAVREQALGESLDPDRLDRLGRCETHLDRKLERTLSMLIKLRDLRGATSAP